MSSIGGNASKDDAVDIKQINLEVKGMMETTKETIKDLHQTRGKLQTIKKAYEILFSDRYAKAIEEAFDHKLEVL
jgi:hypothetical protein